MAKVLTIELGHSVIKLCEMDYKVKKPKIYQCQEAITPAGAVNDGYIADGKMKDLAYAIKETIARNGIKTKKVIFTVASAKIINREVTVPAVKEAQINSVVQANLGEYFPVSLADYEVTQSLIQTIEDGIEAGKHRVLIFAAEKAMLDAYKRLASECELDMINVCCSGASIIESARKQKAAGCQAIIKIEEKYSIISIVKDGVLMLQRSINYGVGDAMNEVATQPSFAAGDTLAVWRLITRQNCTTEIIANVKDAGRPEARAAVTEALNPLISGIIRVFDYFNSHYDGIDIDNMSIIGLGAQFIGVSDILSEAIGIVCRKAGMAQEIDVYDSDVKQKSDAYFSCIGAGFSGDGFLHEEAKGKLTMEVNYTAMSVLAGLLFLIIAATLVAFSVLPYNQAKAEEKRLQDLYDTYEQGKVVYDQYVAMWNLHEQVVLGDNMAKRPNDNILLFLEEMEQKLPYNTVFDTFISDDEQCVIEVIVDDKGTAAKMIDALRTFESLQDVYVETLEEYELQEDDDDDENEEGQDTVSVVEQREHPKVKLTVYCVYYPVVSEEEEPVDNVTAQPESAAAN